jgi:hypothetical protein
MDKSYQKYLKYKKKYLVLKNQVGGGYDHLPTLPIGDISNLLSEKCIKSYLGIKGWDPIVKSYKAGKELSFKEDYQNCSISSDKVPGILLILGGFRLKIVQKIITDTKKLLKENETYSSEEINTIAIAAPGSTNLTSDYDLTVTGKNSSTFIWEFLKLFIDTYGLPPSLSFDSNLYPSSSSYNTSIGCIYQIETKKKNIRKIIIGDKEFILYLPKNKNDINCIHDLKWAFAKLWKNISDDIKDGLKPEMKYLLEEGKKIDELCQTIFCDKSKKDIPEVTNLLKKINHHKEKSKTILTNYYYMCQLGRPLDNLFGKDEKFDITEQDLLKDNKSLHPYINSVLGYSSLIKWLCSEAYYSNFTVYAIVIALQLEYQGDFPEIVWLVAAIENLADLLLHMNHELKEIDDTVKTEKIQQILIKYSKYVYRIVFCLDKIEIKNKHQTLEDLEKVLKLRKTLDLKKANLIGAWKILHPQKTKTNEFNEFTEFTLLGVRKWLVSMKKVYLDLFQNKITELYHLEDLKIEKKSDLIYLSNKMAN